MKQVGSWGNTVTILLLGIHSSGKTTLLHQLGLGNVCDCGPVIGLPVELVEYKNVVLASWDPCHGLSRSIFIGDYYKNCRALIFIVDATDGESLKGSKEELWKLLSNPTIEDEPLLVLSNKTDLAGALSDSEVCEQLGLGQGLTRPWHLRAVSAASGEGVYEGLEWLTKVLEGVRSYSDTNKQAGRIETRGCLHGHARHSIIQGERGV
ncbi:ADP-ribosylation factor family protein Ecym_8058 [Eremothecium cymbalariae DBVPG|uniref:ADP-ribosylation factor n=1 Tax=Eremothecium cymbalariae (strain CBS 270.75 / DBVPG 7215 / KCTC 17166 / NRRL Y-17582) TaxID=931890 RepID=G8JWY0_ERECY|nr:Hypothetical protein Ecym_8058 [Eremothecium cymbalariae DBVPG\